METLQEYLDTVLNKENRAKLEAVINWVTEIFPALTIEIKWSQPLMTLNGTFVIGFSASSKHFSIAPEPQMLNEFRDKITEAGYSHSKALFRILWKQDVNYPLLKELVERSIEYKKGSKTFWAK